MADVNTRIALLKKKDVLHWSVVTMGRMDVIPRKNSFACEKFILIISFKGQIQNIKPQENN